MAEFILDPEHGKSQAIRLADVLFIGPLMIWGGVRLGGVGGTTLAALGVGTIGLNGLNFIRFGGFRGNT